MDNSTHNGPERLVQYLDGELQGNDKEKMEQQLAVDAFLKQQYDSLLLTRESVHYFGLKEKVAGLHSQMMKELATPVVKLKPASRMFRYVASVAAAILLVAGLFFAYTFFTLSSDKVYSANYKRFELSTTRDGGVGETASEKAYRAGNYKEVLRIHDADEDHTPKGEFLCGVAALELNDNGKAIKCFNEVLDANKSTVEKILNDEAEYYLSLSYIRNKEYNQALSLMNKIKDDKEHVYHERISGKLLRQVKMLTWR